MRGEQYLEIKKKSGLSINPDIHHSKVFSSGSPGSPMCPELETLEWWISGLMLNPLFFLISRLNIACSPHEFNLQIN